MKHHISLVNVGSSISQTLEGLTPRLRGGCASDSLQADCLHYSLFVYPSGCLHEASF